MKGGKIENSQKKRFNNIKSNNGTIKNVSPRNIQVYLCSSSSIAIQLQMIKSGHENILGRRNSRSITPTNNLIPMGILTSFTKRGGNRTNKDYYNIETILNGETKTFFVTNLDNIYANLVPGNNVLIIDINPATNPSPQENNELEWAIKGLFHGLLANERNAESQH